MSEGGGERGSPRRGWGGDWEGERRNTEMFQC